MGIIEDNNSLEESDKKYIWHPFTQMKDWLKEEPVIIFEGRDCFLKDIYGNWYLDGVSSLWVNLHGHRRKEIDDAIKAQLDKIAHTTMLGLSNVAAIELAERLVRLINSSLIASHSSPDSPLLPPLAKGGGGGFKVFYSDNGSTAV